MKLLTFLVASLFFVLTQARSPIPKYVCTAKNVQQEGTCLRFYDIEKMVISPTNCYYAFPSHGIQYGKYYYEFKFEEGSGNFVGFTTKRKFAHGYRIRGLFYGGSLSDGSSFLRKFGPPIRKGDKVNLLLDLSKNSLKLYVFHNDVPLGLAFDLKKPNLEPLYPTVKVDGAAYVCMKKLDTFPSTLERQPKAYEGIEGDFEIIKAVDNGNSISTALWKLFKLYISKKSKAKGVYEMDFQVINTISAFLTKDKDGKYTLSPPITSLVGTHGEYAKAESFLMKVLRNFEDISLDGDTMRIKAKGNTF
ncbi:hypothetical protein B4U79_16676, partial [Dinothrombium tinctorium]